MGVLGDETPTAASHRPLLRYRRTHKPTLPRKQSNAQQAPLEYGKRVDAHRLAAVSEGGGWWNPTTQELIPILPEDHPDYRQNEEIITEAIRRWNGETK